MRIITFITLLITSNYVFANSTIPLITGHKYNLSKEVSYILDKNNELLIDDVINYEDWKVIESKNINFSFIKETLWLHFDAISQSNEDWIIKIPFPLLDHIEVHSYINGLKQSTYVTGDMHPFNSRPIDHPHFMFPYKLEIGDKIEVFIKVKTSGAAEVPIHILTKEESEIDYEMTTFLHGWMNGILIVMIFYNMVIYALVRDHLYLSYSMTVLSYILMFAAYNGTGFQFIWPNHPEINSLIFSLINAFYQTTGCVFIIMFLKIFERNEWPKKIFKPLLYTFLILIPITPFAPYQLIMFIFIILSIILNISGLVVGFYYSLKGDRSAIYFTIAWFLLIFSIMIGNLRGLGYLPVNWFTLYSYQIGVLFEVIVLSIALAQRIDSDKKDIIVNLNKYKELYNNTLSGQFTLNKNGSLKSVNPAFHKLLGYNSAEEVIQLSNSENGRYFHADKTLPDRISKILNKMDHAFDLEVQLITKSGKPKWFSMSVQIIKDLYGKIVSYEGSIIDIQERKENENINQRAIQERMIAMEHLVVGICHEINTPLGVSTTAISHLKEDIQHLNENFLNGKLTKIEFLKHLEYEKEAAQLIENNINRINNLVKSFKEISVLQKGYKYETSSLCNILQNQVPRFYRIINPDNIHIECTKPLDFIGYPKAIEDILSQIIFNSIHHGSLDHENIKINIKAYNQNDIIYIEIADNGNGIKIDNIRDIFNPFYTTKRGETGRIGLGLYQVFNIVTQLLDGNIEVTTTNPGTIFKINFPLHVREKSENNDTSTLNYSPT